MTIIAERGEILMRDDNLTEVVVYNGTRQHYRTETQSLDILNFKEYTLEVENAQKAPVTRLKQADERTIFELLNPTDERVKRNDRLMYLLNAELHRRIAMPFSIFSFVSIALACLLVGSFNRRGHTRRIIWAAVIVILLESLFVALTNLIEDRIWAIPLLYIAVAIPLAASIYIISPAGEAMRQKTVKRKAVK